MKTVQFNWKLAIALFLLGAATLLANPESFGNWVSWATALLQNSFGGHKEACWSSFWLLGTHNGCEYDSAASRGQLNLVVERIWWTVLALSALATVRIVVTQPGLSGTAPTLREFHELKQAVDALKHQGKHAQSMMDSHDSKLNKLENHVKALDTQIGDEGVRNISIQEQLKELQRNSNLLKSADVILEEQITDLENQLRQSQLAGNQSEVTRLRRELHRLYVDRYYRYDYTYGPLARYVIEENDYHGTLHRADVWRAFKYATVACLSGGFLMACALALAIWLLR